MTDRATRPGLYVHVPFCVSRCPYCDFYSQVDPAPAQDYVTAVLREAERFAAARGPFDTLYLGGGTPSALGPRALSALVEGLQRRVEISSGAEITIEVNPDDVDAAVARQWVALGINRVSVGVQSFDDDELRFLGRRHDAQTARVALEAIRAHGPQNLSVDLIYGFAGQRQSTLCSSIEVAFQFSPDHLSAYQLTLEPRTALGRRYARGELARLTEDQERAFFLIVHEAIRSRSFDHYEISNFARRFEKRSRHNQKYWQHIETIGLGPAAHSYVDGRRRWNVDDVHEYVARMRDGGDATADSEVLTPTQIRLETLLLGLRTANGVSKRFVDGLPDGASTVRALVREGLIEVRDQRVVPTVDGYLLADGLPLRFRVE